ncbi:MAG: OmpA family protein [Lentisphaerae bacterium]|nr:OmpA family protein [Lentisphaerota bacterium]
MKTTWYVGLACGCMAVLIGGGCGTTGGNTGESLIIEELDGDHALTDRFEDGTRVTDVSFDAVLFRYDSYQIDSSEAGKLERVAGYLADVTDVRLVVEGHCDERGSREYNLSLGEHRALSVRAYLIGLGVDSQRIQTRSFGEERPVTMGHSDADRALNRRGEFALYR